MRFIKNNKDIDNKEAIEALKVGDDTIFKEIYEQYRDEFVNWAQRQFNVDKEVGIDFFHEALASIYVNALKGRVEEKNASIKTYLFAIGKNHLLNYINYGNNLDLVEDVNALLERDEDFIDERPLIDEDKEKVNAVLKALNNPCKSILEYYYLHGYGLQIIAERLEYKNKDVLKAIKNRCIQKLRKILKK